MEILETVSPEHQARIIRGILKKYPPGTLKERTQKLHDYFSQIADRLEGHGVAIPAIEDSHRVVLIALEDADIMIREGRFVSAVDRVHTALHGHLQFLCSSQGITLGGQEKLNQLFNALRDNVPALQPQGTHAQELIRVLRSAAAILDALNPLRNWGTVVHPNENLLEKAEAKLVVNISYALLHYLDAKLET